MVRRSWTCSASRGQRTIVKSSHSLLRCRALSERQGRAWTREVISSSLSCVVWTTRTCVDSWSHFFFVVVRWLDDKNVRELAESFNFSWSGWHEHCGLMETLLTSLILMCNGIMLMELCNFAVVRELNVRRNSQLMIARRLRRKSIYLFLRACKYVFLLLIVFWNIINMFWENRLKVGGSLFAHKDIHKGTWRSPKWSDCQPNWSHLSIKKMDVILAWGTCQQRCRCWLRSLLSHCQNPDKIEKFGEEESTTSTWPRHTER